VNAATVFVADSMLLHPRMTTVMVLWVMFVHVDMAALREAFKLPGSGHLLMLGHWSLGH
jgi:hypothetical protein